MAEELDQKNDGVEGTERRTRCRAGKWQQQEGRRRKRGRGCDATCHQGQLQCCKLRKREGSNDKRLVVASLMSTGTSTQGPQWSVREPRVAVSVPGRSEGSTPAFPQRPLRAVSSAMWPSAPMHRIMSIVFPNATGKKAASSVTMIDRNNFFT